MKSCINGSRNHPQRTTAVTVFSKGHPDAGHDGVFLTCGQVESDPSDLFLNSTDTREMNQMRSEINERTRMLKKAELRLIWI